ncbi:site-specific integrase [Polynucleobacter paneuropaeus]|nr:site-specific integrase [Polynucleobacter paneuropaeus]
MASIQKRNGSYRARIKRIGQSTISRTFYSRLEAVAWVKETQAMVNLGLFEQPAQKRSLVTFEEAAVCYRDTHTIHKKIARSETYRLQILINRWGHLNVEQVDKSAVLELRDDLLGLGRAGDTINHYFNTLSKLFQMLNDEWDLKLPNPIKGIKRMPPRPGRSKRVIGPVESQLLASCEKLGFGLLRSIIEFAIATGMRRGEMMGLHWGDIDLVNRRAYLHTTKNGEPRKVPLSQRAMAVLETVQAMGTNAVFPMSMNVLRNQFEKSRAHAEAAWLSDGDNPFKGLRFHDLRHEALSRLSDAGLNVIELSHISGHKTVVMLSRYTHPSHPAILEKIDRYSQIT